MFGTEDMARIGETLAAASDAHHRLAYAFYDRLFELEPGTRSIFRGDLAMHAPRLMGMLHAIPFAVELPEETREVLREMGAEHLRMGVQVEHYEPMMHALVDALRDTAGRSWDDAAASAWWRLLGFAKTEIIAGREAPADDRL